MRPGTRVAALAAAARAMANTHYLTAEPAVIGQKWLNEWIDQPARQLVKPVSTLMTVEQRREAIGVFVEEQHAFWRGQDVWLGLGHGDFSPGNIRFLRQPTGMTKRQEPRQLGLQWRRSRFRRSSIGRGQVRMRPPGSTRAISH